MQSLTFAILLLGLAGNSRGETSTLSVSQFLEQVSSRNLEVQGAREAAQGAAERAAEGQLLLSTSLFAEIEARRDAALPQVTLFAYDRIENERYLLGVRKLTTFGLEGKIFYALVHTNIVNPTIPSIPGGGGPPPTNYYDARPTVELTQSLWGNGFGRGTRANQELLEAQATAASLGSRFRAKSLMSAAEESYWRLVLARERTEVVTAALTQAEKIHDLSDKRARNNLGDRADMLQATAALKVRQLEAQSAQDEERNASRQFNRFRNQPGDRVAERLEPMDEKQWLAIDTKERTTHREDVQAAEQQQRASIAAATAAIERDEPTLDVYGSYTFNGRRETVGPAFGDPFNAGRPTYALGVKFLMPLDRGTASDAQAGWRRELKAAELNYQQKLRDEEQDWQDLAQRLSEVKRKLTLAQAIAEAQRSKLTYERERLRQGRTTTFQVLTFEQDYAQSQLAEIGAKADLIRVVTQLKLYEGGAR